VERPRADTATVFSLLIRLVKESLIFSEIPATDGRVAIFSESISLKMKESAKKCYFGHAFHFPCSEKSRMDLFRASLPKIKPPAGGLASMYIAPEFGF